MASKEKSVVTQITPSSTAELMDEAAMSLARATRETMPEQQADLAIRITQLEQTEQHLRSQLLQLQDALAQRDNTIVQLQALLEQEKRRTSAAPSTSLSEVQTLRTSIATLDEALRRKDGMHQRVTLKTGVM